MSDRNIYERKSNIGFMQILDPIGLFGGKKIWDKDKKPGGTPQLDPMVAQMQMQQQQALAAAAQRRREDEMRQEEAAAKRKTTMLIVGVVGGIVVIGGIAAIFIFRKK